MSYSDIPTYVGQPYPYDLSIPIPVIGVHIDEDGFEWPIHPEATPEYKARLDAMNNRSRSAWHRATDNFTAEDLDRKCTEMAERNKYTL